MAVEEILQLFVGNVDAHLLQAVFGQALKAENIQHTNAVSHVALQEEEEKKESDKCSVVMRTQIVIKQTYAMRSEDFVNSINKPEEHFAVERLKMTRIIV